MVLKLIDVINLVYNIIYNNSIDYIKLINNKNDNLVNLHYFICFIHPSSAKQYGGKKKNVPMIVQCVADTYHKSGRYSHISSSYIFKKILRKWCSFQSNLSK